MASLNRTEFFKPKELKREKYPMPEWGKDRYIWIRAMESEELIALRELHGEKIDDDDTGKAIDFLCNLLAVVVINDEGDRIFSDEGDVKALRKKGHQLLQKMGEAAIAISGLNENPEKNLEGGQSD